MTKPKPMPKEFQQKKATKNELRIAELLIENAKLKQDLALLKINDDAHRAMMQHFRGELIDRAKAEHTIDARDLPSNLTLFDIGMSADTQNLESHVQLHNVRGQAK